MCYLFRLHTIVITLLLSSGFDVANILNVMSSSNKYSNNKYLDSIEDRRSSNLPLVKLTNGQFSSFKNPDNSMMKDSLSFDSPI